MVRPTVPEPTQDEAPDNGNMTLDQDDIDDAALAAELGVIVQARPVEPLADSQIPSTQPFDYYGGDLPQDEETNKTWPIEVAPSTPSESEVVVEDVNVSLGKPKEAELPEPTSFMNSEDSCSPTEIEATPSPKKVVEVVDESQEIQTRVLPPENPQPVSPEDLVDLRAKIAAIK